MIRPAAILLAIFAAAWAGGALCHEAAWRDLSRLAPPSPAERWLFASNGQRRSAQARAPRPSSGPLAGPVAVTATAPGQGGYVHYFVIEFPDGEREIQVGIELPDGRIAWSFPGLGAVVSPFIASGEMQVGEHAYPVRHLYGIRPFRDEASILELQKDLWRRVIPWIEDATPYCALTATSGEPCLSCLGLVLRVLYPSRTGSMPALPPGLARSGAGPVLTTDDLLLYQVGLHGRHALAERMARLDALALPTNLREDLVQIVQALETDAAAPNPGKAAPRRPRAISKAGPSRPTVRKKL